MPIFLSVFLVGVLLTFGSAGADEPKRDPTKDESFTEKLAIRRFANGKLGPTSVKDVPAFRFVEDGAIKFYTLSKAGATPNKGAEFTDEKGNVYVVERVVERDVPGAHLATVKLKSKGRIAPG